MKRFFVLINIAMYIGNVYGQILMNVHKKDGSVLQIPMSEVDSLSFSSLYLAEVQTGTIMEVTSTTANVSGNLISDGGAAVTEKGVCYGQNPGPAISNNKLIANTAQSSYSFTLINLERNTTYYVRAYAKNENGVAYGDELSFTTTAGVYTDGGGVTDIEGNSYETVVIGTQEWMKSNLKVSKYNDNSPIPAWNKASPTQESWAYYGDLPENNDIYGKLYSWYTVETNKLCPVGWHVPNESEWNTLFQFLGGTSVAGMKMRTNTYWINPEFPGNNDSGFSGLPGGRYGIPSLQSACFWSFTEVTTSSGRFYGLYGYSKGVFVGGSEISKSDKLSIRCIKNP